MKNILCCIPIALLLVACEKREVAEEAPAPKAPAAPKATPTPPPTSPAPQSAANSNDWMWKDSKGKSREADPFARKNTSLSTGGVDNPLEKKAKQH